MNHSKSDGWKHFQKYFFEFPELGLSLDLSRMKMDEKFFSALEPKIQKAFADMAALEKGAIANSDEKRMVGHYWLRNSALAPTPEIRAEIDEAITAIKQFAAKVHAGRISGSGGTFKNLLLIGIGGSALGPQFVANALGCPKNDKIKPFFFDNTDPDGMNRVIATIGADLDRTLTIVVSKSGGTKETRNGMLIAQKAYEQAGLHFGAHTVAVTTQGSELYKYAVQNKWLTTFPMWDWVGGRTSVLSAVGLLPAALQGLDIDGMLAGAQTVDALTRKSNVRSNPAALLSLAWFSSGNGKGLKNMVVLPYRDRLELFSKYLQQLVMESLGKELDLNQAVVNQGLTVLGNKGSTDQHSYVQQLREGLNDFFATFIEVQKDEEGPALLVEPNITSGDFLHGFYLGTRQALAEKDRESMTLTVKDVSPFTVGYLIALFERAVGFYASLVNINAYHQPGVEAGKKAAGTVMNIQVRIIDFLKGHAKQSFDVTEIAAGINAPEEVEWVFKIVEHLSANADRNIQKSSGTTAFSGKYSFV